MSGWSLSDSLNKLQKSVKGIQGKIEQGFEYFIDIGEPFDIKLDIVGDEKISMENDITDNYVETNVSYQDQISVKPITYTLSGEVGELVWYRKDESESLLGSLPTKVTQIATFVPSLSKKVSQVRDKAMKISNFLDSADNFLNRMSKLSDKKTMQEQIYDKLLKKRNSRGIVNVTTPWGKLTNYAITRCELTQKAESKDRTFVTITFKQIRPVFITTVPFDSKKFRGMDLLRNSPKVENGLTTGKTIVINDAKDLNKKLFLGGVGK